MERLFGEPNGRKPWNEAIYADLRAAEDKLEIARQEYLKLLVANRKLRKQLYEARQRLERWEERRQAWTRERADLINRSSKP